VRVQPPLACGTSDPGPSPGVWIEVPGLPLRALPLPRLLVQAGSPCELGG
jgi:hypothetical protein